uniref:Glycine N-acyltransferase-like protein n=1 Tax=Otus sunia TaxID=257818 RepID=A0A8C8AVC7_9STRI
MLVLNCFMKLQVLEKMLRWSFPKSLKAYGAAMNINRGNPFRKEVVVNSWPDFKAVITWPQRENEVDDLDHCTNAHAVFYKKLQAYQELLENTNVINWGQISQIQGLQDGICEISKTLALSKQVGVKTSSFQMVIYSDPDTLPDVRLQYAIHGARSTLLTSFATSPVSVSWMTMGIPSPGACQTSFPHGYTLPEHWRKGYSRLVATTLAKELHSCGFPAQGNDPEANTPSITLLKSMNAQFLPCSFFRVIHTPSQFLTKSHL